MASDSLRLYRIQEELNQSDPNTDQIRTNSMASDSVRSAMEQKLSVANLPFPRSTFDAGFSDDDDDEDTLPPYPDVFEGTIFEEHDDFPTPVPAQIGVVRPLLGASHLYQSSKDPFSETLDKVLTDNQDKEQRAVQVFTEKYDTLGKVRPQFELARIPQGYINTNSPALSSRSTARHVSDVNKVTSAFSRTSSEFTAPSFSEILQIHSPSRTLSMSLEKQLPDIQSILSDDCTPKRNESDSSWTTAVGTSLSPSKTVLPVDVCTALQRTSITHTPSKGKHRSSLSDHELLQVEMFYRSHKTQVFVSTCTADLYYGSARNVTSQVDDFYPTGLDSLSNWRLISPGVPLVLLDSGESRRERKLHLRFAERGTGFPLWKDQFNHLTHYEAKDALIHTMHLSSDHSKLVAFKFHDAAGATDFLHKIHAITSNPDMDDILNLSSKKKKKDKKRLFVKTKQKKLPSKTAISAPCCFTHITTLDRSDGLDVLDTNSNPAPNTQHAQQ